MSTEWKFAFLNSTIKIFYLIYSVIKIHHFFLDSFLASRLATFRPIVGYSHKSNFENVPCDITIATGDRLVPGFDDKYKLQFVYRSQALKLNPIEYLRFISCYGKTNRETFALAQWNMIGNRLFVIEPIGNVFCTSVRGNIWNSNVMLHNKTTCFLRCWYFNRYLSVVTPVYRPLVTFKRRILK